MTFSDIQFLRPEWLWAFVPALLLGWVLLRRRDKGGANDWTRLVDSHLLKHLVIGGAAAKPSRAVPVIGAIMIAATIVGLAGPTWQERQVSTFEGGTPVVAVLSLAQSMNADDLTPSRLKRSVHKLRDILDRTEGDERGLVIYSDAAFVAAPLTSDPKVIEQMLPELSTSLMPVLGNRLDIAIAEAHAMLTRASAAQGDIIVLADDSGDDPAATVAAASAARSDGFNVSVLGAGTVEGAILQTADGRAIAARNGQTYTTSLSKESLEGIASAGGGAFSMVTPNDADLKRILSETDVGLAGEEEAFQADSRVDSGYLLLILPALFMPFAFRRGLVLSLTLGIAGLSMQPGTAKAGTWDDLWATPEQQAQAAYQAEDYANASALFETRDWRGAAAYRAGDFTAAATDFSSSDYNRGNALAKSGQLKAALESYDAALAIDPADEDAQFNRDLIADLLKQQEQQKQQQQGDEQQQDQQQAGDPNQQDQQQAGGQNEQQQDQQQAGDQNQQQNQQQADSGQDQRQQQSADSQQEGGEQQQAEGQEQQAGEQQEANGQEQQAEQQQAEEQQASEAGSKSEQAEQSETAQQDEATEQEQGGEQQASDRTNETDEPGEAAQEPQQAQTAAEAEDNANEEGDKSGLGQMLSDLLGEPDQEPQEMVETSSPGAEPIDQAIEQQLRRVPDDASGLLRARIRQHYARQRRGG